MAPIHGKSAKVFVNGYDVSGYLNKVSVSGKADTNEDSRFGQNSKTYAGRSFMKDGTLAASGFLEYAVSPAKASADILAPAFAADKSCWTYLPAGDALGNPAMCVQGIETTYDVEATIGGLQTVSVDAQAEAGAEPALVQMPLTHVTVSGNSGTIDNGVTGSPTTNGASAILHVTQTTGVAPSTVVKVQHSTDGTTWADLITFAAATAVGSQRVEVAGTVNRYTRALHTLGGQTTDITYHVAFARKP